MKILILNIEKELEAHLFRIRSTHEYYKLTQYELQTLTPLDGRAELWFWLLSSFIEEHHWKLHRRRNPYIFFGIQAYVTADHSMLRDPEVIPFYRGPAVVMISID